MDNIVIKNNDFNPVNRGKNLTIDFDNVVKTFDQNPKTRVHGLLSADIYDTPQFEGDRVNGSVFYREAITTSPDYYLYNGEPLLLREFAGTIGEVVGKGATIYDLGPGPSEAIENKTAILLDSVAPYHIYKPIDVAPHFIEAAENTVLKLHPNLPVKGEVLNFQKQQLPDTENDKSLILYLGSTISNAPSLEGWKLADNPHYVQYLSLLRRSAANKGYFVFTHDCNQDEISQVASYNYKSFANIFSNVTHKIKRDLLSDDMDADAFKYGYEWNARANCVEHALVPLKDQTFTIHDPFDGRSALISVKKDERYVHVNSYKPKVGQMQQKLLASGWQPIAHQVDETGRLATHLCLAV